jgi:adenosylmethionine-8-amino-7-oxononanoate aminotransferase
MCVAKGLTGGMLPLAATLASNEIFAAFRSSDRAKAFFHGHTFTAHPIGCAVALASLRLIAAEDTPARLDALGRRIEAALADLRGDDRVLDLRRTGGIVALELRPRAGDDAGYLAARSPRLRAAARERGVLRRPLGNVLYAMPPACTSEAPADAIAAAMRALATLA